MPLWVFEGIDGCGKETQWLLLIEKLEGFGIPVKRISFPVYESRTGMWVKAYLDGKFGNLHPYFASLLFAADRLAHRGLLEQWLQEGAIVLANRYTPSNLAHQASRLQESKRRRYYKWWSWLEYSWFGLPKPDLVIWLDAPVEVCFEMKRRQLVVAGRSQDIHERDKKYQQEVCVQYRELFQEGGKTFSWIRIDCAPEGSLLPKEELAEAIWQIPQIRDGILERAILARSGKLPLTNVFGLVEEFCEHWERTYIEAAINSLLARWMLDRVEGTILKTVERRR